MRGLPLSFPELAPRFAKVDVPCLLALPLPLQLPLPALLPRQFPLHLPLTLRSALAASGPCCSTHDFDKPRSSAVQLVSTYVGWRLPPRWQPQLPAAVTAHRLFRHLVHAPVHPEWQASHCVRVPQGTPRAQSMNLLVSLNHTKPAHLRQCLASQRTQPTSRR